MRMVAVVVGVFAGACGSDCPTGHAPDPTQNPLFVLARDGHATSVRAELFPGDDPSVHLRTRATGALGDDVSGAERTLGWLPAAAVGTRSMLGVDYRDARSATLVPYGGDPKQIDLGDPAARTYGTATFDGAQYQVFFDAADHVEAVAIDEDGNAGPARTVVSRAAYVTPIADDTSFALIVDGDLGASAPHPLSLERDGAAIWTHDLSGIAGSAWFDGAYRILGYTTTGTSLFSVTPAGVATETPLPMWSNGYGTALVAGPDALYTMHYAAPDLTIARIAADGASAEDVAAASGSSFAFDGDTLIVHQTVGAELDLVGISSATGAELWRESIASDGPVHSYEACDD